MTRPEIPDLDLLVRPPDYKGRVVTFPENPLKRVLSATIWVFEYFGWRIYDVELWYACADCGSASLMKLNNASLEEIAQISMFAGTNLFIGYVNDPTRLTYDVEDGAWSWRGTWVEYPDYQIAIAQDEEFERMKKTRRESQTIKLAMWFVENILHEQDPNRVWTSNDFSSAVTKHAALLLKKHSVRDICGCLEALRDEKIGDGYPVNFMKVIETSGEPPYISQWQAYLENEPPVYLEAEHADWEVRRDRDYAEVLIEPYQPVALNESVDLNNPETRKPRARKAKTSEQMGLL